MTKQYGNQLGQAIDQSKSKDLMETNDDRKIRKKEEKNP